MHSSTETGGFSVVSRHSLPGETEPTIATNTPTDRHRCAIKWLVAIGSLAMAFDVYPSEFFAWPEVKQRTNQALSVLGVEQSQWRLFAPDPALHAWWFEAEIDDGSEQTHQWVSPQWPQASNWEKFYRFREINFYDRIGQTLNEAAHIDFANWIRQQQVAPENVKAITIYKVEKVMLSNPAEFPTADETMWTFGRQRLVRAEYGSP